MSSIKKRVLILFFLSMALACAFGFLAFSSFQEYTSLQSEYEKSYTFVEAALALRAKQKTILTNEELLARAQELQPEHRKNALTSVVKNASLDNVNFLLKAESEYRNYLTPLMQYFKKRTSYFGALALASSLVFIFGLSYFVFLQVFSPLKELSNKMHDFIHNKYSYQFTVPAPNEIGQLQTTFDALAQKVLSQIEELQSLDKAKSEFLSIASHELRTPLTSIKGSLGLLNSGVAGEMNATTKNLMNIALTETDRLIRIINELLDLAKIEARQFPLNCDWHWGQSLVHKTFQSLHGFCQSANVKLESTHDGDFDLFIDVDRVQQVLTNLLSNAIKFSPTGEAVRVHMHIEESTGHLRVDVIDRGRGIAPEDQELIFEKFRQATGPQNPLVKGTGLGLAIAKALVEQHGGRIGVLSKPGFGSTFYFTLPKWQHHSSQHREVAS